MSADEIDKRTEKSSRRSMSTNEPLAIVGMSCRMPNGGNSPDQFWTMLEQGRSDVSSFSDKRFIWPDHVDIDNFHHGIDRAYLVDNVDSYDTEFFGISPKEAEMMDPQQRMLLELSWEALEYAGAKPSSLSGSSTGVFIGTSHCDYTELASQNLTTPEALIGTGNVPCILANRLSYFYNLKGPSFTVDTACSSSLFALSQAVDAIEAGQCTQALVGSATLILTGIMSVSFYQAGMTSRNNSCMPFDQSSDGYIRGEGGGMIFIKKLSDAKANGDNVLALVKGRAINHGGHGKTITSPNARAQAKVIETAIENAGISPSVINYIETHGTGTPVGDPIEFQGLLRSFRRSARKGDITLNDNYCALGAVKADIGHLEPAAGMASLIKVLMAIKHRKLPANRRLTELNHRIKVSDTPFYMIQKEQDWLPVLDEHNQPIPLHAGISSFGFGGTNAHVILQQEIAEPSQQSHSEQHLFVLTARSANQLAEYVGKLLHMNDFEQLDSANLSFTLVTGREFFDHRLACVYSDQEQLRKVLTKWLLNQQDTDVDTGIVTQRDTDADPVLTNSGLSSIDICTDTCDPIDLKKHLANLAKLFVEGVELPFQRLFNEDHRRIAIATYPFARERHWLNRQYPGDSYRKATSYSAIHGRVKKSENLSGIYCSTYSGTECFFLDHRLGGNAVLPGMAFLELARGICQDESMLTDSANFGALEFSNISWLSPMIAQGKTESWVKLDRQENNLIDFQFYPTESATSAELFCRGSLLARNDVSDDTPAINIKELLASGDYDLFSAPTCYQAFTDLGIKYGSSHRALKNLYVDKERSRVLAEVKLPEIVRADAEQLVLHPSILDAALQATLGFSLNNSEEALDSVNLPFALEKFVYHRMMGDSCWVEITCQNSDSTGISSFYDLTIYDDQGRLCITLTSLEMRKAPNLFFQSEQQRPSENEQNHHLLVPQWQPLNSPTENTTGPQEIGKTLAIGANQEQVAQLCAVRNGVIEISLPLSASTEEIIDTLEPHKDVEEIVVVFGKSGQSTIIEEELIQRQYEAVRFFLAFAQALASLDLLLKEPRLVFITQQSSDRGVTEPLDAAYNSLHGMIGSFAKEFVNCKVKLIDMELAQSWRAADILALPFDPNGNALQSTNEVWYRQVLARENVNFLTNTSYKQGGVYLIIGGAGGIGELLTEHIVEKHQAQVVWLGRREISDKIQKKIERLNAIGPVPVYMQGDSSDLHALREVRKNIIDQFGSINAVIHSAMVLEDATMENMSEGNLQRVLQSKVATSVNMALTFATDELDFLLFFSSVNSYLKAPGQSNYVAGCAFTDALAQQLRQQTTSKVKVVNWGYWGTLGAVADEKYQKSLEKIGFASIQPDKAMSFLDVFLTGDLDSGCYIAFNRDNLHLAMPVEGGNIEQINPSAIDNQDLLPELSSLIQAEKSAAIASLREYFLKHVVVALYLQEADLDSEQARFEEVVLSNLGLDSLLASNLRYQILRDTGVDLPVQIFIGDQVATILEELYQQLLLNHVSSGHEEEVTEEFEQFVF